MGTKDIRKLENSSASWKKPGLLIEAAKKALPPLTSGKDDANKMLDVA
ncbi:hypothetical protein [Methylotuvimicrobium buryatense]|nr:hypothetical protein [Methylotuvimicrobium buryatense]